MLKKKNTSPIAYVGLISNKKKIEEMLYLKSLIAAFPLPYGSNRV